jgi:hypothetical protein
MNVPPLNIGVINLTVDTATGTLYVPNGTDTIGFYDLSGNPLLIAAINYNTTSLKGQTSLMFFVDLIS